MCSKMNIVQLFIEPLRNCYRDQRTRTCRVVTLYPQQVKKGTIVCLIGGGGGGGVGGNDGVGGFGNQSH